MAGFLPNLLSGVKTISFAQRQEEIEVPDKSKSLADDCATALEILTKLTTPDGESKTGAKGARMPREIVASSQAIAFMVQTKAGVGVGVSIATGFVINRLGPKQWSAPSYFRITIVSAGLTLAVEKVSSAVCIKDQSGLGKFTATELQLGADAMVQFKLDPTLTAPAGTGSAEAWGEEGGPSMLTFSLVDGVGLNISFTGGLMSADKSTNRALFGEGADPEKLLHGEIPAPQEFAALYEALNALDEEA